MPRPEPEVGLGPGTGKGLQTCRLSQEHVPLQPWGLGGPNQKRAGKRGFSPTQSLPEPQGSPMTLTSRATSHVTSLLLAATCPLMCQQHPSPPGPCCFLPQQQEHHKADVTGKQFHAGVGNGPGRWSLEHGAHSGHSGQAPLVPAPPQRQEVPPGRGGETEVNGQKVETPHL